MHIVPVFIILCLSISKNTGNDDIGISACRYNGDTQDCKDDSPMSIDKLPHECTAWLYDGLIYRKTKEISTHKPKDKDIIKDLGDSGKPLFLFYQHENLMDWIKLFKDFDGNINKEVETIKAYIGEFKVTGLILAQLEHVQYRWNTPDVPSPNFSDNIIKFVKALKSSMNALQVGLYISARNLIYFKDKPIPWFDFKKLIGVMDYFVVSFKTFNRCEETFLQGGIIQIDPPRISCNPNTLNLLASALSSLKIPKEKLHFELIANPIVQDYTMAFPLCDVSFTQYCQKDDIYKYYWCTPNSTVFNQQGVWAQQNGKGFIVKYIDTIDRKKACECGNKYISFFFILEGFNGKNSDSCKKLDDFPYTLFAN